MYLIVLKAFYGDRVQKGIIVEALDDNFFLVNLEHSAKVKLKDIDLIVTRNFREFSCNSSLGNR